MSDSHTAELIQLLETAGLFVRLPQGETLTADRAFDLLVRPSGGQELLAIQFVGNDPKYLVAAAREIESFIWDLYAAGKRNSVSALLLVSGGVGSEFRARDLIRLRKLCRVIVVNVDDRNVMSAALNLLTRPGIARHRPAPTFDRPEDDLRRSMLPEDVKLFDRLIKYAGSEESPADVSEQITKEFDYVLDGVRNALKKP